MMLDSLPPSPKPYPLDSDTARMRQMVVGEDISLLGGSSSSGAAGYLQARGGRSAKGSRVDVSSTAGITEVGSVEVDLADEQRREWEREMRTPAPPYRPPTVRPQTARPPSARMTPRPAEEP